VTPAKVFNSAAVLSIKTPSIETPPVTLTLLENSVAPEKVLLPPTVSLPVLWTSVVSSTPDEDDGKTTIKIYTRSTI